MTVSKTRAQLIDVARQLFAKEGVENTTMNDIAAASHKGRRTLYTYFKSKEEIYGAVVEQELDKLLDRMQSLTEKEISPDMKLIEMIYTRNGTLRANFFRDIWQVEKVRKQFDMKERTLIRNILAEGQEKGVFEIDNLDMTADILHYCVKGIEVPYIRGQIGAGLDLDLRRQYVQNIVFGALRRKENNPNSIINQ